MDVWNMKFISRVEQDISLVRFPAFVRSLSFLDNTGNKFRISPGPNIMVLLFK